MLDLLELSERVTLPKRRLINKAALASSSSSCNAAADRALACTSLLLERVRASEGESWNGLARSIGSSTRLGAAGGAVFEAKKLDSFCCLVSLPLVAGVLRLALCIEYLDDERSGVLFEPEARLVRSPRTGLGAESALIHPVGLIELVVDDVEEEPGVWLVA